MRGLSTAHYWHTIRHAAEIEHPHTIFFVTNTLSYYYYLPITLSHKGDTLLDTPDSGCYTEIVVRITATVTHLKGGISVTSSNSLWSTPD